MDDLELGGNIVLTGFKVFDRSSMVILKKIIGNYARKLSDVSTNFERLHLTIKPVHTTPDGKVKRFELNGKLLDNGKAHNASVTEHNIFVGVDSVLKKLETIQRD